MDRDEVMRVLRAFESAGLEYVLIGAAAMGFHGLVRTTEDLDLFIRATSENIEKLRSAFRAVYEGDPNIDEISADDPPLPPYYKTDRRRASPKRPQNSLAPVTFRRLVHKLVITVSRCVKPRFGIDSASV